MAALTVGPDVKGRVVHIADGLVVDQAPVDAQVLACPDGELGAGGVNAHTHLYSGLAPLGMPAAEPAPENFLQILERVWWRLDRALDADSLRASARLYVAESLLLGTTTLVDHHESPSLVEGSLDILAAAFDDLGARGLLCYGATERNFGRQEAMSGLGECARFVRGNRSPRLRGLVGLHASFTVGDATIKEAGALCADLGVPLHVHVAEDGADLADAKERKYPGPLERLAMQGCLPPGSVLAHGVHLSTSQVALADARRCWLVHNPRSNEGNGVGFARTLDASTRVALGTDGWQADMAAERAAGMRLGLDPRSAQARSDSGHALVAERFGTASLPLYAGSLGDVVVRRAGAVQHVVVHGQVVVRDGSLVRADLAAIRADATSQARGLWKRMADGS